MLKLVDDGTPAPPALFSVRLSPRWGDLDADGRINNVTVLRYVEEARMRFADHLDLSRNAPSMMPVVGRLGCEYHAPLSYPGELDIRVGCNHVGRSSVGLVFEVVAVESGVAHATACATWVWVDKDTERPVEMPEALRRCCLDVRVP